MWDASVGMFLAFLGMTHFFTASEADCRDIKDCKTCTGTKSWLNTCRWCPRDNKCHAFASLLNKCARAENILVASNCGNSLPVYDPVMSDKMVRLSAVAYDKVHPQKCSDSLLPQSSVIVQTVANGECGIGNQCSGYLAYSEKEQAIIVAFRGTDVALQLIQEAIITLLGPKIPFLDGRVQVYWGKAIQRLWAGMQKDFVSLRAKYPNYKIWVTGHSLGGALASLASIWIVYYKLAPATSVFLYTFGMPRVGDYEYALEHDRLVNISYRVVNLHDPVPHLPTLVPLPTSPYHHGIEIFYDKGATSATAHYRECHGLPHNEDITCSNVIGKLPIISSHLNYFGVDVGGYCEKNVKRDLGIGSDSSHEESPFRYSEGKTTVYRNVDGSFVEVEVEDETED